MRFKIFNKKYSYREPDHILECMTGGFYHRKLEIQEIIDDICERMEKVEAIIKSRDYHFTTETKLVKRVKKNK
jgi:hypothetical protein